MRNKYSFDSDDDFDYYDPYDAFDYYDDGFS